LGELADVFGNGQRCFQCCPIASDRLFGVHQPEALLTSDCRDVFMLPDEIVHRVVTLAMPRRYAINIDSTDTHQYR